MALVSGSCSSCLLGHPSHFTEALPKWLLLRDASCSCLPHTTVSSTPLFPHPLYFILTAITWSQIILFVHFFLSPLESKFQEKGQFPHHAPKDENNRSWYFGRLLGSIWQTRTCMLILLPLKMEFVFVILTISLKPCPSSFFSGMPSADITDLQDGGSDPLSLEISFTPLQIIDLVSVWFWIWRWGMFSDQLYLGTPSSLF